MHMPVLEITTKAGTRRLVLTGKPVTVGRSETCSLAYRDSSLSRKHCVIEKADEGYVVRDLDSRNGTLVNGSPIKQWQLASGDTIRVGRVSLHFRLMPVRNEQGGDPSAEPVILATEPGRPAQAPVPLTPELSMEDRGLMETPPLPIEPAEDKGDVDLWRQAIDTVVARYGHEDIPDDPIEKDK